MTNVIRPLSTNLRMPVVLAFALAAFPNCAALASDICADLSGLAERARSNFQDVSPGAIGTDSPLFLTGAGSCAITRSPAGVRAFHCAWEFEYRETDAFDTHNAFIQSTDQCFENRALISHDQRVNHPDFYDLRLYQLGQVDVSVSIKDKSALQKTYIFVRVQRVDIE